MLLWLIDTMIVSILFHYLMLRVYRKLLLCPKWNCETRVNPNKSWKIKRDFKSSFCQYLIKTIKCLAPLFIPKAMVRREKSVSSSNPRILVQWLANPFLTSSYDVGTLFDDIFAVEGTRPLLYGGISRLLSPVHVYQNKPGLIWRKMKIWDR